MKIIKWALVLTTIVSIILGAVENSFVPVLANVAIILLVLIFNE